MAESKHKNAQMKMKSEEILLLYFKNQKSKQTNKNPTLMFASSLTNLANRFVFTSVQHLFNAFY